MGSLNGDESSSQSLFRTSLLDNVDFEQRDATEFDAYYFPEMDGNETWFELNCFKCTCRNCCCCFWWLLVFAGAFSFVMYWFRDDIFKSEEVFFKYLEWASIPIICGIFTYGHIALALWMTLNPIRFIGCCQQKSGCAKGYGCGWQGIVPNKAALMAEISVDLMVPGVIRVEDVIEKLDPDYIAELMNPITKKLMSDIVPKIASKTMPTLWSSVLPEAIKATIIERAVGDAPETIKLMIQDLKENINEVFDLKDMCRQAMLREPALLNEIFLKSGKREFVFIRAIGGCLGLLFGLIQMVFTTQYEKNVYFHYSMLPASGFILGYFTNWVAINLIFRPLEPVSCCCFTLQGSFLKRQREVSQELARILTERIIHARYITEAMMKGKSSDKMFSLIQKHIELSCDRISQADSLKTVINLVIGEDEYRKLKAETVEELFAVQKNYEKEFSAIQTRFCEYGDRVMDIRETLRCKLQKLTPTEFEGVLRPVFQQDELKLIVLGGVLGLLVGLLQVFVINRYKAS